jgi:general secretion pathway protein J
MRRRAACRGFTLVEALVATSLIALLCVMIFVGMQTGFRMWTRSGSLAADIEETAFAQGFLRRAIEGAYPRLKPDGSGAVDFEGDSTNLEFLGPSLSAIAIAGRVRYRIEAQPGEEGGALALSVRPDIGSAGAPNANETLLQGARSIRISYLARGSSEWTDHWRDESGLPELVRILVEFPDKDVRQWPDLVVRPLLSADVDCRLDPLTRGCKGRRR